MKILFLPFRLLWRVWFYIAIFIAIILLLPFLYINSLASSRYRRFFILARWWGWIILVLSGLFPRVKWKQKPDKNGVYIICANHTSMMDIMMTFAIFPNCFLFIGKKELAKIPVFGYFYSKTNILVDRNSLSSKKQVMQKAAEKIDSGIGLCIYPEGGVPPEHVFLAPFKNGAFKLASEKNITIIPVIYPDNKKRLPYNIYKGRPGISRAVVLPFLQPKGNSEADIVNLRNQCYEVLHSALHEYQQEI